MNVFVLSTGRCGSTTFAKACGAITNFTVDHESERRRDYGQLRERYQSLHYPNDHIEIDNRLSWFLGTLDELYGPKAFYVHLLRDREEVASSFLGRWKQRKTNIIFAFAWGVLTHPYEQTEQLCDDDRLGIGRQYWDTVNSNIRLFLKDKPLQATLWLNEIKPGFEEFWHRIGAEGDLSQALATWDTLHNSSPTSSTDRNDQTRDDGAMKSRIDAPDATIAFTAGDRNDRVCSVDNQLNSDDTQTAREQSDLVGEVQSAIKRAMSVVGSVKLEQIQPSLQAGAWTFTTETIRFIASLVNQLEPEHVIEFGSGLSTRVLAWACGQLTKPSRITSFDHDPEFMELTRAGLNVAGSDVPVSFVLAPIVARKFAGNVLSTYYLRDEDSSQIGCADLIIIDGPPRALGGRESVLYQAMEFARPGTLILLDDAHRAEEKVAVSRWKYNLGSAIEVSLLPGFSKGLAAIIIKEVVDKDDLPKNEIEPTIRAIGRLIQPGTKWIIVDDGKLEANTFGEHSVLPFLERDGEYWGCPSTDAEAIAELERLRQSGARFLAFAPWSFWWLDYYHGFRRHLESSYRCVLRDHLLVVFDMREHRS